MITLDYSTTASFDIDCQQGFTPLCPLELPVPDGDTIVSELNHQSTFAKYRLCSKDAHPPQAVWRATETTPQFTPMKLQNSNMFWNMHCMVGTQGFELIPGLPKMSSYDFFIYKGVETDLHPYSPIYHDLDKKISTGIIEWLKAKGVRTVIVGGLALNYCMGEGALDLQAAGFDVIVNLAATKGLGSQEDLDKYVKVLREAQIVCIENSNMLTVA